MNKQARSTITSETDNNLSKEIKMNTQASKIYILIAALAAIILFSAITPKTALAAPYAAPVYDATGAMLAAITPKEADTSPLPVYDATAAMLAAINPAKYAPLPWPVYDATAAMLAAVVYP